MPVIKTNKQYNYLVTFGCSFTSGHWLGDQGAWGHYLAQRLNCKHLNQAGGASNPNIVTSIINYCEHNDMSKVCVGIQWSEITRRELWMETKKHYYTLGLGVLFNNDLYSRETHKDFLQPIKDNLGYFSTLYFDIQENVLRTVLAMMHVKSYLEYKNIDFIQFEGINSILDIEGYDQNHEPGPWTPLLLTSNKMKYSILQDKTFFSRLGDLNSAMQKHPKYDATINDGHPHTDVLEYWADHLYDHIKISEKEEQ